MRRPRVTIEGLEAFVAWSASGGVGDADRVRALEHEADDRKRDVRAALTESFTTPLDAEDLYTMSERLDGVMTGAKNAVREAEVMGIPPDDHVCEMAEYLLEGVQRLDDAFSRLTKAARRSTARPPRRRTRPSRRSDNLSVSTGTPRRL